jgi:hypothetical protein
MAKISSEVEVCNLALLKIGQNSISELNGNSDIPLIQICNLVYQQTKSELLSQYNWTFALDREILSKVEVTDQKNMFRYKYLYALPEKFLRLIDVYDGLDKRMVSISNGRPPWELQGKYIVTDSAFCKVEFVKDTDNVSRMSPLFIQCFVTAIAIKLTKMFNDSSTYLQLLMAELEQELQKAKINDCQQTMLSGVQSYPILCSTMDW